MKQVLFYGNIGNPDEPAKDGQRSKTRNFYQYTQKACPNATYSCFNTHRFKRHIILNFLRLKRMAREADIIVLLPGSVRSLNTLMRALGHAKKVLFYPVVGGWIAERIRGNETVINFLKTFRGIYPETNGIKRQLADLGIVENVKRSPTFTMREPIAFESIEKYYLDHKKPNEFHFVYFGRITETKGIYKAISAIKALNSSKQAIYKLDFFGKKHDDENYQDFDDALDNNIRYLGELPDADVWKLSRYDYFLFPTFYPGEGMPACCIESLIYGTPIIASDWRYNNEIVTDGHNGFLFDLKNDDLKDIILKSTSADIDVLSLKKNAFLDGKKYTVEEAIKPYITDFAEAMYE